MDESAKEVEPMTESQKGGADKIEIEARIAELSRLLGMIPGDDTIAVKEPVTQESLMLSQWFRDVRSAFLKLSVLLEKALDLNLR